MAHRVHTCRAMRIAAALVLVLVAPARADETIEITDLRAPRLPSDDPAAVSVLERSDIERTPLVTTDDVIRLVPSVAMFRRSSSLTADPTSQGLNLRGVGPSAVARALVLRDGIPLNDPFGGWVYWRAVPTGSIERIEIQPSGATLFGNFGLGGAVGISSRSILQRSVEASALGGSFGTFRGAVRGTERIGDLGIEVDAERLRSDGFVPISEEDRGAVDHAAASEHVSAGLRLEHERGGSRLGAFGRVFDEDLDAGTQFTTAGVRTLTYGASWQVTQGRQRVDVTAFAGHQQFDQTRARVTPDRASAALSSAQETPSNNQGASAMWTRRLGAKHTLQLGADAMRVSGTATDRITPAMVTDEAVVERAAGGEQRFLGVFAQDSIQATSSLELGAAVRIDGWQQRDGERRIARASGETMTTGFDDRNELQLSPRLGALYHVDGQLAMRGSVYRAFRAPTLNELYRPFQVGTVLTAANADLAPEILWGGELGPQVIAGTLVARATAFYNRMTDPITNATLATPAPDGAMRMRQNLGRARVAGLQLEASWRPREAWVLTGGYTCVDAKVTEGPEELVGKRLAQDPKHRATGSIGFDDRAIGTFAAEVRYVSRQFEDDLNTLPMGGVVLVDLLARRHVAYGISAFASAINVFDRRYIVGRAGVDTIGQPRTILVGLAFATGSN